jgi:hypothetical protein
MEPEWHAHDAPQCGSPAGDRCFHGKGMRIFLGSIWRNKMNMSDTVLLQRIELCDAELDAVSAGLSRISTGGVLEADLARLEKTILTDLRDLLEGGRQVKR